MVYFFIFVILALIFYIFKKQNSMFVVHLKDYILPSIIVILLILIVCFSSSSLIVARESFMLWVNNVIPSLLPFFICIEVLKKTNFLKIVGKALNPIMYPIFNVPGCGAFALAMGITSGYPVGAKVASDLYLENLCSKTEAERLIAFTNSSGPLFIIGAIGSGMFFDSKVGLLLFLTHFLSSITVGFLFRFYKRNNTSKDIIPQVSIKSKTSEALTFKNIGKAMGDAMSKSISTLLLIAGYIVFFAVLSNILEQTGISSFFVNWINEILKFMHIPKEMSNGIFTGILEITNGINKISTLKGIEYAKCLPVVAFILGFGGFSVHMQVASIIADAKLSMKPYLAGKFLQGIFASIYTYLLMKFTNFFSLDVVESFNYNTNGIKIVSESSNLLVVILTLVAIGISIQIIRKMKI